MSEVDENSDPSVYKKSSLKCDFRKSDNINSDSDDQEAVFSQILEGNYDHLHQIGSGIISSYDHSSYPDLAPLQLIEEECREKLTDDPIKFNYEPNTTSFVATRNALEDQIHELSHTKELDDSFDDDPLPSIMPFDQQKPLSQSSHSAFSKILFTDKSAGNKQKVKREESKGYILENADEDKARSNNRKDVVIRGILRSMRKYYGDLLKLIPGYTKDTRNIKLKHRILIKCSI